MSKGIRLTEPPVILEGIEKSDDARVAGAQKSQGLSLREGGLHFILSD